MVYSRKLIRSNVSWLIGIRILRLVIGVIVLGAVARHLGPEQFGVLNYAIALTGVFSAFATLGMDGIVIRELVNRPTQSAQVLGTAFVLRLSGAAVAIILVFLASLATRDSGQTTSLAIWVSLCFVPGSIEVIELWFQKNVMARHTAVARVGATVIVSAIRLILVFYGAPLFYFALMQAVDALLGGLALVWAFRRQGQAVAAWRFDTRLAGVLFRSSWALMFSAFLIAIYTRIEQVLVKNVLGDHAVGMYYSAIRLSEVWNFVPIALLTTIYPMLVATFRDSPSRYQEKIQTIFDLLTALGYVIAVGVTLLGPALIPLIFGSKYTAAIPILIVQAWIAPVNCSALTRAQTMLVENRTVLFTPIALLGIAANVPLALWFMQLHGAKGAALAVLVASFFSGYLTSFMFPKLHSVGFKQTRAFLLPFRLPTVFGAIRELR